MRVGIGVIAYNQPKTLIDLVRTAHMTSHELSVFIYLHNGAHDIVATCDMLEENYPSVIVFRHMVNRGVSTSWNDALIEMRDTGCDVSIITNDDVWFEIDDVDKIAEAAVEHRDAYAIFCAGYHVGFDTPINCHGMSCFAMQPIALETVGFYDENFFPAYNEDVDYSRRAAMADLKPFIVPDTMVHHIGSAAIQTSPTLGSQNHGTHHMNNLYWTSKWGCPVSEDPNLGHRRPFGNRHFHPYFISEEKRHRPYPAFNRSDRHIVRI